MLEISNYENMRNPFTIKRLLLSLKGFLKWKNHLSTFLNKTSNGNRTLWMRHYGNMENILKCHSTMYVLFLRILSFLIIDFHQLMVNPTIQKNS